MIKYAVGAFDVLRAKDLDALDGKIQRSIELGASAFGLGIYSNEVLEQLGVDTPLKSLEDRMVIMSQIRGVDFVFPVFSLDATELSDTINAAYREFQRKVQAQKNGVEGTGKKEFEVGYAPGTYDLFHAGHLENLTLAAARCNKLIAGVKADILVEEHKHRLPTIGEDERAEILRHFKFIFGVCKYFTRDPNVACHIIEKKYGKPVDAIFLGSDLKEDFKRFEDKFTIVYTERDPILMKERSTTAYRDRLLRIISEGKFRGHVDREQPRKKEQDGHLVIQIDDGETAERI